MSELKEVLEKLAALQSDVDSIKHSLALSPERPQHTVHKLTVFFDRSDSERKPYLLKTEGIISTTQKLSSIRAAIMLVLLLDLQERAENSRGIVDPLTAMARAANIMQSGGGADESSVENVRVALYRAGEFFKDDKEFASKDFRLWFDAKNVRLLLFDKRSQREVESSSVQVTTNNAEVAAVINQTLSQSPINRARKRKALYVPAGPEGSDRLLLEIYDHNFPLKITSLYVRPPFQSYPVSLLEYIGVPEIVIQRKRLAFEGYKSGRCRFVEILAEETIWDIIRLSPEKGFKLYPQMVRQEHVLEHLDNLIHILKEHENYNLYLTGVPIPFVLVTYEIKSGVVPEHFTLFFQAFTSAANRDLGCFALCDPLAYQSIHENIIDWILAHPTTVKKRDEVIEKLSTVRKHLAEKGPLPAHSE